MTTQRRVPWDFSTPCAEGEGHPNVPTDQGRELGAELARLTDVAEADQLKTFPDQLPRCDDCAFRAGTAPNGCSETLMDAIKCVVEMSPFYCHKGVAADGEPKHMCRGYLLLISTSQGVGDGKK